MAAKTSVRAGASYHDITSAHVRVSGTWQPLKEIWSKVSGTWQKVYSAFSAVISAGGGGGLAGTNVSGSMSAPTLTGGTSPYTYNWQITGGQTANVSIVNSSLSSITVNWNPAGSAGTYTTNFTVTVTDTNGQVATSNTAALTWSIS